MKHYKNGVISFEEAMANATNPDDFDLRLRGITGAADRWEDHGKEQQQASEPPKDSSQKGFTKY